MLTLNSGHTVGYIRDPDFVGFGDIESTLKMIRRGHWWLAAITSWTPPIPRLRTQPFQTHQSSNTMLAACFSKLTQVVVDFAVAVHSAAL